MSSHRPIIVVGSINVDFTVRAARMATPGHTQFGTSFETSDGGKGANQAHAAASLGADVHFVGRVGGDILADGAVESLRSVGINTRGVGREPGESTGVAFVQIDDSGENAITIVAGANARVTEHDVRTTFERLAGQRAVVVLGFEVPVEVAVYAAKEARLAGWTVILNPAPIADAPTALYYDVDVLVPNEHELSGIGDVDDLLNSGTGAVVVTRGSQGVELFIPGQSVERVAAYRAAAVDTTGAGDAFIGALAWSIARGDDLAVALRNASAAGAFTTLTRGARSPSLSASTLAAIVAGGPVASAH